MDLRGVSAGLTDIGKVRRINEDAFLALPKRGLWAVADGMGGHEAGEVASRSIVGELEQVESFPTLEAFVEDVKRRLWAVNLRLQQMVAASGFRSIIGSTVIVLLAQGDRAACLWAGDSRIYRLRGGALERLTRDHSEVEELIASGRLNPEDSESHPSANVITRAIGAMVPGQTVEDRFVDLRAGDRFLVCSDGLYRYVEPDEMRQLMGRGEVGQVCRAMFERAHSRQCADNLTLVMVEFRAE
jgi:protein phosphatase